MSSVEISDCSQGLFRVAVTFAYDECDRLPFNALRKVRALIEPVARGGLRAICDFNLRRPEDAAAFVELLALFGEGGLYRRDPSANLEVPAREYPPHSPDASRPFGAEDSRARPPSVAAAAPGRLVEEEGRLIPESPPRHLKTRHT